MNIIDYSNSTNITFNKTNFYKLSYGGKNQMVVSRGWGTEEWGPTVNGHRALFWGGESVLEVDADGCTAS